jgi:hypothetical protein
MNSILQVDVAVRGARTESTGPDALYQAGSSKAEWHDARSGQRPKLVQQLLQVSGVPVDAKRASSSSP